MILFFYCLCFLLFMVLFMTNGTAVIQMGRTVVCTEEEGQYCNTANPSLAVPSQIRIFFSPV